MPLNKISENNPDLEEMHERGWCFIQVGAVSGKNGAPFTSHERAEEMEAELPRLDHELRIISWK